MTPAWLQLAAVLVSVASAAVAAAAFVRAGRRMDKGEAIKLEARLVTVEERVSAVPTHQAVHDLAISIEHLAGEVKALNARHEGMAAYVERLETVTNRQEDFLMGRGAAKG